MDKKRNTFHKSTKKRGQVNIAPPPLKKSVVELYKKSFVSLSG